MAKVMRSALGGAVTWEEGDAPSDLKSFNRFGKSAVSWLEQTKELHRAALHLMEKQPTRWNEITRLLQAPIALMLGAYAIETLLKMVIVAEYCEAHGLKLDSCDARDFIPHTHDLKVLVNKAKLRVNKVDRKLLDEIKRYSIWAGRYPIPKTSDGYEGPATQEAVKRGKLPYDHPLWPQYVGLYGKLFRLAIPKTFRSNEIVLKPKGKST